MRDFKAGQLDGYLSQDELAAASIMVNLFDSGPKSIVSTEWRRRIPTANANAERTPICSNGSFGTPARKSFVQATVSTHIFEADLSADLPPGYIP